MILSRQISSRLLLATVVCASIAACGEDEPKAGSLGTECSPEASACINGLECTPRAAGGHACTHPAGAACNLKDGEVTNGGCAETAECVVAGDVTTARCLIREGNECDPANDLCSGGLDCATLQSGGTRCYGEVVLSGEVTDTSNGVAIENAHVIAVDEEGVAVTDVARSDAMGNYDLAVPVVRNDDGTPMPASFTLRAAAQQYQPFPSGVRVALPIDVGSAAPVDGRYVVDNALTDIGLIPLAEAERSSISGSIVALQADAAGEVGGVLVVATGGDGAYSGLSDKAGAFTIFNVPAGDYELRAYAADIQIESESVSVTSEPLEGVELSQLAESTATVSGSVQIVDAAGGSVTSIILVVADTFDATAARGEAPRGLRAPRTGAPNVTGDFMITGVPIGRYIVLAAYENDGLVRDPDTNIAGTDFVPLEVMAGQTEIAIAESFKVTAALETIAPGADQPEAVTANPLLEWGDDASEGWYDVRVFDAFGDEVWNALMVPGVDGASTVTLQYEGPLEPGMYYQFRVSSWRQPGMGDAAPISTTEDLRGVFFLPAP